MADIHKIIAGISPDVYCDSKVKEKVKKILKAGGEDTYTKAIKEAVPINASDMELFDYDSARKDALSLWGLKSPIEQHELRYDSATEGLEPIYFWILDFMSNAYKEVEKITDNFVSSPGSGHFSEMQGRMAQMQGEISRTMGNVNTVIKSILNLIYDLKDFNLRMDPYERFKSKDFKERYNALLSLKQLWLDNVDIRRGRGSINALSSGELDFVTLRDAFMAIDTEEACDKLDLNDRVKRMLKQRANEFFKWIGESEKSLTQRREIEKNYLRSQVNMLKLYSRWVKPYLKAAQKLEQKYESMSAALVTTFNTMLLELAIMGKSEYKIVDDVDQGLLPETFKNVKTRKYYTIVVVELKFRSIPQKVSQRGDWAFGGRSDIKFTSYALNEQELEVFKTQIEKDDLTDVMKLIQGATEQSLDEISKDIDELLGDAKKKDEEKKKSDAKAADINPFSSLLGDMNIKEFFKNFFSTGKKDDKKFDPVKEIIKPDNEFEKVLRSQAIIGAREKCFTVYDIYKKAHGMPTAADTVFDKF